MMNNEEFKRKPKRQSYKIVKERPPKQPTFKLPPECREYRKFLENTFL
jgi:hypothetical protein